MMNGPLPPFRNERTVAGRATLGALRGGAAPLVDGAAPAADGGIGADQQAQIAAQHQAFDYEAAERAEILREHEVLEALLMAHLKNEDEITKKWIAMI